MNKELCIYVNQNTMDIIKNYSSDEEEEIVLEPNIIVYNKADTQNEVDIFTCIIVIALFTLLNHIGIII